MYQNPVRVHFPKTQGFRKELNTAVKQYFDDNGISERGDWRMWLKTAIIVTWLVGSYTALMFLDASWAVRAGLCVSVGLALAGFVFCVGHDGNHGAYGKRGWVNALAGASFDLVGACGFLWRFRHNIVHHTYTNIAGVDHDISTSEPFFRTTEQDTYLPPHRFQHWYAWFLYAFLTPNWAASDFQGMYLSKSYCGLKVPKSTTRDHVIFWLSKVSVLLYILIFPLLAGYSLFAIVVGVMITEGTLGFLLAIVFQLAHVVEPAQVLYPAADDINVEEDWAVHQLKTSVDFAPRNVVLNWYLGGLNYQAIHHLFPKVCHVHYPQIAKVVAKVCAEHGVAYQAYPTARAALASHFREIRRLSDPTTVRAPRTSNAPAMELPVTAPAHAGGLEMTEGLEPGSVSRLA